MSYSKYYVYKKQYSNDDGYTWHDVEPAETAPSGTAIGTYETLAECETPPTPACNYLTFTALEDCTFGFYLLNSANSGKCSYSLDNGATWNTISGTAKYDINVSNGNKVLWKAERLNPGDHQGIGRFKYSTGRFNVEGDIMSLDGCADTIRYEEYFFDLFNGCTGLTSAENLVFPDNVTKYCYNGMFFNCQSLTKAPSILPATTLASYCYAGMFGSCFSLETAPVISATTLAVGCCSNMFYNCYNLVTAPTLLATTLREHCYEQMFYKCRSLNAITCLASGGYYDSTHPEWFGHLEYYTTRWLLNTASSGVFTGYVGFWPRATSANDYCGIPEGWTVQNYTP